MYDELMQAEHQPNVDEVGREAIAAFFDAATGRDVVFSAAKGLRKTLELADHEDIAQLKLDTINEISNYVFAATRKVADHVGDKIGEGRVYLGMSAATGLLSLFGKSSEELRISTSFDLLMDRFDHVTLLAAELDVLRCRKSIEQRGNPFQRAFIFECFTCIPSTALTKQ